MVKHEKIDIDEDIKELAKTLSNKLSPYETLIINSESFISDFNIGSIGDLIEYKGKDTKRVFYQDNSGKRIIYEKSSVKQYIKQIAFTILCITPIYAVFLILLVWLR